MGGRPNRFQPRYQEQLPVFQKIRRKHSGKVFRTTITKSVRLEESPAYKESIFTFAPQSAGAYEYYKLSEEVLSRV